MVCAAQSKPVSPKALTLNTGWAMQDAVKVSAAGGAVSGASFDASAWYRATVPGTALTTLVDNGIYPEPTYGENDRPEVIPDSLARASWWYRAVVTVPANYAGRHVWLNFDGINYAAEVWVNGVSVGTMRGAFIRGRFDVSAQVKPGTKAVIAVLVAPQPHPGEPHEHTIRAGMGKNGGVTASDGPTFLSTIGWDWLPAVRDRDTGIWQKVWLSSTGEVELRDPLVTTKLPLPKTDSADVSVTTTAQNLSDAVQHGVLEGSFEGVRFAKVVELAPHETRTIVFDKTNEASLHLRNPKLWWPNGYGPQNLYSLRLRFVQRARTSDESGVTFGVREITYKVPDSDNLTISVNGQRVFVRGGNWGLDEMMKRIPPERLEAEFKLHKMARLNMIRNWVGQSTSEEFYTMADKYGILLWDEFFQPNPHDGPNPDDIPTYIANVRDKILRYRNHPSIAVWCARNEGPPPQEIDAELRKLMAELEPTRLYQPSSTDGRGVKSGGPYRWRTPEEYYKVDAPFKTEIGSMSVPTLESVHAMMPRKDWETINDDWAEHDFAAGAQRGNLYKDLLSARYGAVKNLADFVRKAQMMNYEAFRAMYEGRAAKMFAPATGVITWMSKPAHPSFTWQLYDYSLEPMSSLYAVKTAGAPVHVALNESDGTIFIANSTAVAWNGTLK
ncbi:MAG: sugar-binding domain-containing protein, partial [Bryocella sp.]